MSTIVASARRQGIRRWGTVAAVTLAWFALYQINKPFWDWLIGDVAGLDLDSRLGSGVHFFFYDTVKILLLLSGIIFLVTVLRSFMSVERTRASDVSVSRAEFKRVMRGEGRIEPLQAVLPL